MFFRKKKKEEARAELRRHYRRAPGKKHALGVKLAQEGAPPVAGDLVDLSAGGTAVSFAADRDPGLDLNDLVQLSFTSLVHGGEVLTEARVCTCIDGEGTARYGFEFDDPGKLFDQLDAYYFKFFNRRRAKRVRPALDTKLVAQLAFGLGSMEVRINDITPDGFGVAMTPEKAHMLEGVEDLECLFRLPKSSDEFRWQARAVHLSPLAHGVLFGAVFLIPDDPLITTQRQTLADYCGERKADMARWDSAHGD